METLTFSGHGYEGTLGVQIKKRTLKEKMYMYVMYSWIAHVRNFHCQEFPKQSKIVTYL